MPVLLSKTEEKVLGEILVDMTTNTGLTRAAPGSKLRALSEAVAKKIGRTYKYIDTNIMSAFLSGASDRYLDFFGEMLGTPRLGTRTASVSAAQRMVKFYVAAGTFGTINGGSSILIPSGTIVSTSSGGAGKRYQVLYNTVLGSAASSAYVSVESLQDGSAGNVGAGRLIHHDFINYTDYTNQTLLVTNEAEIQTGRDIEGNENYRYRLSSALTASERANFTSVRLAALSVPGVADLVFEKFARGLGTFDIAVKSVAPSATAGLIAAVQEAVDQVAGYGIMAIVKAPEEVGVSMSMTLVLTQAVTDDIASDIISNVQQSVTEYVNNLDIGEDLVINEIVQRVMETDDRIKDMGVPGKPLDSIYIYKNTRLKDNKNRYELTANYVPEVDERVIVETTEVTGDPIAVTINR